MENVLNVSALNGYIKSVFNAEELLHDISVCGEVSGISVRGGNAYFDLKDEQSKIPCSCFSLRYTYLPKDGESVIVFGSVDFWAKTGKMSFIARSIKPFGEGALALKLEQLKNRLREEGYFDESHKKPIPQYPRRVCVLTSLAGAVRRDIVTTIRAKNHYTDIDLADVPVQGTGTAGKICETLALADEKNYDVIVIARGGGSLEELMPFNDEGLVKAIYAAKTPIISAVGHETDLTLCDLTADMRAPTPTAAANMLAFDSRELTAYLDELICDCKKAIEDKTERGKSELLRLCTLMSARSFEQISDTRHRVRALSDSMIYSVRAKTDAARARVSEQMIKLKMLDPRNMLARGYFILGGKDGEIHSVRQLSTGQTITVTGCDGSAAAEIKEVKYDV